MDEVAVIRSFCTLKEMMDDRGLDHQLHSIANETITAELQKKQTNATDDPFITFTVTDDFTIVYVLPSSNKSTPKNIMDYLKDKLKKNNILLVTNEKMNTNSMKTLVKHNDSNIDIQVYSLKELQFNPYKHALVPKHRVLTPAEEEQVMTDLKLRSRSQLPIILRDDAIARYLNIKSGSIVHITRVCPTSAEHNVYRYCI
jgi:DNA-directed RNA polymerase I, II, and III subunit RPABC1